MSVPRIQASLEVEHLVRAKPNLRRFPAPGDLDPSAEALIRDRAEAAPPGGLPEVGRDLVPLVEHLSRAQEHVRVDPDTVGTLLQVGRGKRPTGDVADIVLSRRRARAGPTAPPQGLFLMRVFYGEEARIPAG